MKRIIAYLLCAVLLLSFPMVNSSAATAFESQTNSSTPLFLISGSNNKGGQEFVPSQNTMKGIQVYLESSATGNNITVAVYKGSVATGSTNVVHQETLTIGQGKKWFELTFSKSVSLTPGELYSFSLNTTQRAVLYGATGGGTYLGLNYDLSALGGWSRANVAAFKILSKEEYQMVMDKIDALPATITLAHQAQVEAARDAYNALLATNKSKVTNLAKLEAAEQAIETLINADRDTLIAEIVNGITALKTVTRESSGDLKRVNQKIHEFCYTYGYYQNNLITNLKDYDTAIAAYNDIINYVEGDVNTDTKIDAKDALEVLKASVDKIQLTEKQGYSADVTNDQTFNAKDALMILQYSVGKRFDFPSQALEFLPYEQEYTGYSEKGVTLYQTTYQSMIDRIEADGYTHTSITGAYDGMFSRDTSIQVMAHMAAGDYDTARSLLSYIVEFHKKKNLKYAVHIMYGNGNYSAKEQIDSTFFFLHAWYLFATNAPATTQNKNFIDGSLTKVKEFANYYLDQGDLHSNYNLMFNSAFEHTRDTSYWQSYDLLTNVYASQGLHEMAEYFKKTDATNAKKWEDAATKIADGIHKNLTVELDGALMYAELRGRSQKAIDKDANTKEKFVVGFSWVNMAPMGCDWYAADPEIMEHTYQMYLKYGACRYYRKYTMLDACTIFNISLKNPLRTGSHVIGKGLAWELLYCAKMGYSQRISELSAFLEENSDKMYRETWVYSGGGADTGNQEQASWLLYALKTACPDIGSGEGSVGEIDSLRVGSYNIYHLGKVNGDAQIIANVISDYELDVVGLQEVDKNAGRDGPRQDQAKVLADKLGWYYGFSKAINLGSGEYGNAIISKYPIESYKTVQLSSPGEEQRVMGHAVLKVGDKKINMLNCHLAFSGLNASQVQEVKEYVAGLDNYILTGDFNTSPANLTPIGGAMAMDSGIDNILTKNFTLKKGSKVDNNYSDHKMVYTDVSLVPAVTGARIASLNLHILQDVGNNVTTMANFIKSHNLEIVGLQEVDNNTGRNGSTLHQAKALADALGWHWGYSKAITLGSGEYGHAIISKYPIESYKTVQLDSAGEEQRVMGHAVIKAGEHKVNVLNLHLSFQSKNATQISQVADYVKNMSSYIITGDFNTTVANLDPIAGTKVNNGTDVFITNEDGAIDNIIVKGYTVGKGTMVETDYSDHNMLYADVTF